MKRQPSRREKAASEAFAKGLALHRKGQAGRAELYYRQALASEPEHFDSLHLLGVLEGQNGNGAESLDLLQRAAALRPDNPAALNNLGNAYGALGRHEEAVAAFEQSLAIRPDDPRAFRNRGTSLRALRRPVEALASFERALALKPDYAEAMLSRAEMLQYLGRDAAAIEAFRTALAHGADDETIRFALAALGVEPTPDTAPAGYVAGLFDGYAETFDDHLVGSLKYRAPALLVDLLKRFAPAPADIVDLGCGTGLCGPLLRPLARRLVGIDLSAGMLARARTAGDYDALEKAEMVAWLGANPQAFDVAVAADVFIYVGDLDAVFAAVRAALRPGGRLVFSLEAGMEGDFELRPTRRYRHASGYVERLAAQHGLAVEAIESAVLREDESAPVDGLLVCLRTPQAGN